MPETPLYSKDDLAWFAREYGTTAWLVHATGPDDIYLTEGGDDLEDDPGAKPMTREGALRLAAELNVTMRRMAGEFGPDPDGYRPRFAATIFHRGEVYDETVSPAADELRWAAQVVRRVPAHKHPWELATADLWEQAAEEWNVELDVPECPSCGEGCGGHVADWVCVACCGQPVGTCSCIYGLAYKAAQAFTADLATPAVAK